MIGDFSIKCKYRDAILNQIKKEINPSENDLMLIRDRLNKATSDELERTYEAFERFGVKIVMDLVRSWKIVFMGGENMKYKVTGHATVVCSMIVESNTEKEAIEKANEQFWSLANYTGMGGIDKMIGVPTSEDDRCIYPDSDVEFDDVLPFTE